MKGNQKDILMVECAILHFLCSSEKFAHIDSINDCTQMGHIQNVTDNDILTKGIVILRRVLKLHKPLPQSYLRVCFALQVFSSFTIQYHSKLEKFNHQQKQN